MSDHALLSPSSAHRWLNCPLAPRLEATLPEKPSEYAHEGTVAHSVCEIAAKKKFKVYYPELEFCTDNGAMIAFAGAMRLMINPDAAKRDYSFNVRPRWPLDEIKVV